MESEESKEAVCVNENRKSTLLMPRFLSRLAQLPIVKSACEQMSDMYERTKEKNLVSMVGFSAAEVSMNAVVVAAKITYTALPSSGVLGKMKEGLEEKGKPLMIGFSSSSKMWSTFKIFKFCT